MNKLKNFPVVNFPNLRSRPDRLEFMIAQSQRYGFQIQPYITEAYEQLKDRVKILLPEGMDITVNHHCQPGICISFLEMIKAWYDRADEQYGLFCDDDISFETVNLWPFTWQDILDRLPLDWECVQLIRINDWLTEDTYIHNSMWDEPRLNFKLRLWDDWGSSFICKRSYAKKLLDRNYRGPGDYDLHLPDRDWVNLYPVIENMLFRNLGTVYNLPLLIEKQGFDSSQLPGAVRLNHKMSHKYYSDLWYNQHSTMDVDYLMQVVKSEDYIRRV